MCFICVVALADLKNWKTFRYYYLIIVNTFIFVQMCFLVFNYIHLSKLVTSVFVIVKLVIGKNSSENYFAKVSESSKKLYVALAVIQFSMEKSRLRFILKLKTSHRYLCA